jgi:hypothetical protein
MTSLRLSLFAATILLLTACSGSSEAVPDSSPTDAGGDAAPAPAAPTGHVDAGAADGAPAGDADGSAQACTTLLDSSTGVTLMSVADVAPSPAGGIVHDGTYVLTDAALYVGAGGASGPTKTMLRMTIRISGTKVERAGDQGATAGTIAPSGTSLTSTDTCPDDAVQTVGFTATATSVTAFIPTKGPGGVSATLVQTYTK